MSEAKKPAAPAAPPALAIQLPKAPEGRMCLRVNGSDHFIDPSKYRVLIEALNDLGYEVPHFCFHPGLEPDGNCRMCAVNLVDVRGGKPMAGPNLATQPWTFSPKPIVSCRQPLDRRGMVVETESEAVKKARQLVMEFLLINHPLDCFVCDKAGECTLQNNSFAHGHAGSRFQERKNEKPRKELGPTIDLWTDRCILCRRCTRFLEQVSGTNELYITGRGDRSEISIAPGHPVDNPLMGNIVDLCPVGALIDKDLKYSYRAWYFERVDTVCPACSKGCNIQAHALKNYVRRLVPREHREVNGWWMCDRGRKDFPYIHSDRRVMQGRIGREAAPVISAAQEAGRRLAAAAQENPQAVAGLCSAWLTLEELHLFKTLFSEVLKSPRVGLLAEADGKERVFPKFKIEADHNPNRAGAKRILGPDAEAQTAGVLEAAQAGRIKVLYLALSMPHYEPPAGLLAALEKVETVIVQDLRHGPLTEQATIVLPGSSFAEKDGVFVNSQNRAQVLRRAIDPLGQGNDDLAVLQRVAKGAGAGEALSKLCSARVLFQRMAGCYPFLAGLSHRTLGRRGAVLETAKTVKSEA